MVTTGNNSNNNNHNNNMEHSTPNNAIRTNLLTLGASSLDSVSVSSPPGDEATSNSKSCSGKADLFLPLKFLPARATSITKEWVKKNWDSISLMWPELASETERDIGEAVKRIKIFHSCTTDTLRKHYCRYMQDSVARKYNLVEKSSGALIKKPTDMVHEALEGDKLDDDYLKRAVGVVKLPVSGKQPHSVWVVQATKDICTKYSFSFIKKGKMRTNFVDVMAHAMYSDTLNQQFRRSMKRMFGQVWYERKPTNLKMDKLEKIIWREKKVHSINGHIAKFVDVDDESVSFQDFSLPVAQALSENLPKDEILALVSLAIDDIKEKQVLQSHSNV